jgi:hypothetical protein
MTQPVHPAGLSMHDKRKIEAEIKPRRGRREENDCRVCAEVSRRTGHAVRHRRTEAGPELPARRGQSPA